MARSFDYKGLLYSPEVLGGIGLLTQGLSGASPGVALPSMMQGMKTASMFSAMEQEEEKKKLMKEYADQIPSDHKNLFKMFPIEYAKKYLFPKDKKSDIKSLMIPGEDGKYGTPKTFNLALPEDFAEFNKFIDQKGVYEVKAPAVVTSSLEGMTKPEKSSKGTWEKEIKGQEDLVANLERMDVFYDERFLQLVGKGEKEVFALLDKFGVAKQSQVQFLQRFANWEQAQEQYFNAYRKLITGVAAGEKEIAWIQASIPSSKDSPSVYRSKVKLQKEITKGIIQRAKAFKGGFEKALDAEGNPTKEFQEFLKKEGLNPSFDVVNATQQLYLSQGYDDETMEQIMNLTFENIDWFKILQAGAN